MRRTSCADAMYRTPARSAAPKRSRSSSPVWAGRFHQMSAIAAATKLSAFSAKTTETPKADRMRPASAGPTARAPLTVTPPSADDAPIISRGTSSGWMACQAGEVRVDVMPRTNVKPSSVHGVSTFAAATTVRAAATMALTIEPQIRSLRRSRTSESTPAGSENSIAGAKLAVCTSAMTAAPAAASTRYHWAPTVCIQVPMLLPSCANHSTRKAGIASGAHAESFAAPACEVVMHLRLMPRRARGSSRKEAPTTGRTLCS